MKHKYVVIYLLKFPWYELDGGIIRRWPAMTVHSKLGDNPVQIRL